MNLNKEFKSCFVAKCPNTTTLTPEKLFIDVPKKRDKKKKWFKICKASKDLLETDVYCCEDHFELPDVLKNYMQIKVMKGLEQEPKPVLKKDVYPTKFECQQTQEQHCSLRSKRINEIQHIIVDDNSVEATKTEMMPDMNIEEENDLIEQEPSNCIDSSINFIKTEVMESDDDENPVNKYLDVEINQPKDELDETSIKVEPREQVYVLDAMDSTQEQDSIGFPENNQRMNISPHFENSTSNEISLNINPGNEYNESEFSLKNYMRGPYECKICQMVFVRPSQITNHMKIHPGEKPFECLICQKKFTRVLTLEGHMKVHSGDRVKLFECSICQKKLTRASTLQLHMKIHLDGKLYGCSICQKKFVLSSSLTNHMRSHSSEKQPIECSICQKLLAGPSTLKSHMRTHSGETPYQCSICHKCFGQQNSLRYHKLNKLCEKTFGCSICQMKFHKASKLKVHMRNHSGERPFHCSLCPKKYSHMVSLQVHMKIHCENPLREKNFECSICEKKFVCLSSLKSHIQKHSGENEKSFECSICQKNLATLSTLKSHLRIHSGEKPYQCSNCQQRFAQPNSLRHHRRRKCCQKFVCCPICQKIFYKPSKLKIHMESHPGERPFQCSICPKKFIHLGSFQRHTRKTHHDEKPFELVHS